MNVKYVKVARKNAGITIIESVITITILAVMLSVTGRALASFHVSMEMQKERMAAAHACGTVLNAIREKSTQFQADFPYGLTEWIESQNGNDWASYRLVESLHGKLDEHAIEVTCTNLDGDQPGMGDTLLQVSVVSTWTGMHGRPMRTLVTSLMTDR